MNTHTSHTQHSERLKWNNFSVEAVGWNRKKQLQALHSRCSEQSPAGLFIPSVFLGPCFESKHLILLQIDVLSNAEMQEGEKHSKQLHSSNHTGWATAAPSILTLLKQ